MDISFDEHFFFILDDIQKENTIENSYRCMTDNSRLDMKITYFWETKI